TPGAGPLAGGNAIDILGQGFVAPLSASVGGRSLSGIEVLSATHVRGLVPASSAAGASDVVVVTGSGTAVAAASYHYFTLATAELTPRTLFPAFGPVGGGNRVSVVVEGLVEGEDVQVQFGTASALIVSMDVGSYQILVDVPVSPGIQTVPVTVTQGERSGVAPNAYSYRRGASVASVSPDRGPVAGGTSVTVTGDGFVEGLSVRFGALPATAVDVVDGQTMVVTSPPGAPGPVDIRVALDGDAAMLADGFIFEGPPAVWVVDPPRGAQAGGTLVEIFGTGFPMGGDNVEVLFGGVAATEVQILDAGHAVARTPPGYLGLVRVAVRGDGVEAAHPNGFAYFDPASIPGTWGGPVDGTLNVTVIDGGSGGGMADAFVNVGPNTFGYSGRTDANGQITFSGPDLVGDQIVTTGNGGFATAQLAGFNAENVTLVVDPVPTCSDVEDTPCDQVNPPSVSAQFHGTVVGSDKFATTPWGLCSDWDDDATGLCATCTDDAVCGDGSFCGELPAQGLVCTRGCDTDDDCNGEFRCIDPSGEDRNGQCVPPAPEVRVYCDLTQGSINSQDTFPFPGILVDTDNTVQITTSLGNYAAFCWQGDWVRGDFRPFAMGVTRHLGAFANGDVVAADVRMDIPLNHTITGLVDRPPMGFPGEAQMRVAAAMNLGGDGVLPMPPIDANPDDTFEMLVPTELTGDIADATYDIFVSVNVPSLQGNSNTLETGLTKLDSLFDLQRIDAEWTLRPGVETTTRGVAGDTGEIWIVGDDGRIQRSFAASAWATQQSKTKHDLYGIDVAGADLAIAVGYAGVATHYDGLAWTLQETGGLETLKGVAIVRPEEAYAVGASRIIVWDGASWGEEAAAPAPLNAVVAAADGVWAIGDAGTVLRRDAGIWTQDPSIAAGANLHGAWADADHLQVIVGAGGLVLRREGEVFVSEQVGVHDLHAAWGNDPADIYVVGARGSLHHFDGEVWEDQGNPAHQGTLWAVGGAGERLWAMGAHERVLGPMLAIAENLNPFNGGFLGDRIGWTVPPSLEPDFQAIDFGGAAGPCTICGQLFTIPYTEWDALLDGDLTEAWFPASGLFPGGGGVTFGFKQVSIIRVKLDRPFDFDQTASNAFSDGQWKSWSTRSALYIK
ncbi:MAG: hypothetical protein ACI9MR_002984, partial [Myxococcota bacterium]